MKEIFEISKEELIELIECQYRLAALVYGGDFLDDYKNQNKSSLVADMDSEDAEKYLKNFGFRDIAEFEVGKYEVTL